MKAIRTRFVGQTDRMPARWKAEDGDGNSAFVPAFTATAADAVDALCAKMGWRGELVSGGFKNDEYWVWFEQGTPRITVTGAPITEPMREVLAQLRAEGASWVAEAVERHWQRRERYYIDDRVHIKRSTRKAFDRINDLLLEEANKRFEQAQEAQHGRNNLVATRYSWTRLDPETGATTDSVSLEGRIDPVEADANCHLLAAAWDLQKALLSLVNGEEGAREKALRALDRSYGNAYLSQKKEGEDNV